MKDLFISQLKAEDAREEAQLQSQILRMCGKENVRKEQHHWLFKKSPGPMPQTLSRSNLHVLKTNRYFVAEKSDGDRFLLFSSRRKGRCYLIGRDFKLKILSGQLSGFFASRCFNGQGDTLLDGELVEEWNNGEKRLAYLLFDVVELAGKSYLKRSFEDRLEALQRIIRDYRGNKDRIKAPFALQTKTIMPKKHVEIIFQRITQTGGGGADDVKGGSAGPASNDHGVFSHTPEWLFTEKRSTGERKNMNDGIIFTPAEDVSIRETELVRAMRHRKDVSLYVGTHNNGGETDSSETPIKKTTINNPSSLLK
eukprot:jgi/Bigna1/136862/aug1.36_g11570